METLVSDVQSQWTYDELGRLTDEVFTGLPGVLEELDDYMAHYRYDLVGNRLEKRLDPGSDGQATPDEITSYTYDANDRLTREELDTDGTPGAEKTKVGATHQFDCQIRARIHRNAPSPRTESPTGVSLIPIPHNRLKSGGPRLRLRKHAAVVTDAGPDQRSPRLQEL